MWRLRRVRLVIKSRKMGARTSRGMGCAAVVARRLVVLLEPWFGFDFLVVFAQGNKAVVALRRMELLVMIGIDVLGAIWTKPIPLWNRI